MTVKRIIREVKCDNWGNAEHPGDIEEPVISGRCVAGN